jgi:DNA-binding CsgD family transcriptional regulator
MSRGSSIHVITADLVGAACDHDFGETLLPRLSRLFDLSHITLYRPRTASVVDTVCPREMPDVVPLYFAHYMKDDHVHAVKELMPGAVVVPTRRVDRQLVRRSAAWSDIYRVYDIEHLAVVRADDGTAVVLTRGKRHGDFEQTTLTLLSRLQPILAATLRRVAQAQLAADRGAALAAFANARARGAWLLFDRDGRLLHVSTRLASHLPDIAADLHRHVPPLAHAARQVCGAVAAPLEAAAPVLLTPTRSVRASLQRLETEGGPIVVVEFAVDEKPERLARWAALHDLSPAQLRVLCELARGGTSKEIGRRLYLSADTVRTHLTAAFRKLNVHSRVEAVIALRNASD